MDQSRRQITKIAREVSKFTVRAMKAEGIGTAEFDFIHLVRHHPGITQTQIRDALKIDKGAAARRAASLEAKGYLCAGKIRTITAVSCCTRRKKPKACEIPRRPLSRRFMSGCSMNCLKATVTASAAF